MRRTCVTGTSESEPDRLLSGLLPEMPNSGSDLLTDQHLVPRSCGALADYGWNDAVATAFDSAGEGGEPVRVVRVDRTGGLVATRRGVVPCRFATADPPVTGDWGQAELAADAVLVVRHLLDRRTVVRRIAAAGTGDQILVANLDTLFVLHGIDRPHRVGRLQRLCILAWEGGVHPVVVLTKIDLAGSDGAVIEPDAARVNIDDVIHAVEVHAVSAVTGNGLDSLAPYVGPGRTVGMAGESGSGKSTLVNALVGASVQATASTRPRDHKGRHTTTARRLLPMREGAVLVDTPGLRSITVPASADGLTRAYADLEALFARCRFRDCAHRREPGCAIKEAIAEGNLGAERWAGYEKLRREMEYEARRAAVRARRKATPTRRPPPSIDPAEW